MSAQTTYKFNPIMGAAGGIFDLAPYEINTFLVEEETGDMGFGVAVVSGTKAGSQIKLPSAATDKFEGITVNRRTTELDLEGKAYIRKNSALGVMRYGRIFAKVASEVTPEYGDPVYVVISGDEKGFVTNKADGALAINAKFQSGLDNGVALVEIANAPYVATE